VGGTRSHDHDVSTAELCAEVDRLAVAHGHGRVLSREQDRGRPTDDIAAPDDDSRSAGQGDPIRTEDDDRGLSA
jgi:hypothetical protein